MSDPTLKSKRTTAQDHSRRRAAPALVDPRTFLLNIDSILTAHFHGHIDEACALRAIAKAIRQFLLA